MRKNLFLMLIGLFMAVGLVSPNWVCLAANEIFVAADGLESNPGTIDQPTTLTSAITRAVAGTTIHMRGGTYAYSTQITVARGNDGSSTARKCIFAYGSEKPILDFSSQPYSESDLSGNARGLQINGHYWHVKGITVRGAADNGIFIGGNYNIIENCEIYENKDSGFQMSRYLSSVSKNDWPSYNQVINCYSHDNYDLDNGEDADGFAAKLSVGPGNIFKYCIAAYNVDDGWDLYTKSDPGAISPVTIENCISYRNGQTSSGDSTTDSDGNGFKLGGEGLQVDHIVRDCIAFQNKKHGFTYNSNPGSIEITNCTAWNNGTRSGSNFAFDSGTHKFSNNLSYRATSSDKTSGTDVEQTNVWWKNSKSENAKGLLCSDADFLSLSPSVSRDSNGYPVIGNFLKLASDSDLKGAGTPSGTDIGASFAGGDVQYPTPRLTPNITATDVVSVTVIIDNWGDASIKQYRIDNGNWQIYNSPVTVIANCTISARGADANGNQSAENSLVISNIGGTSHPTPRLTPNTTATGIASVTVTIDNWGDASIKQYRIDNGSWQTYDSPVTVTANCTISARGADANNNYSAVGSLAINNIIYVQGFGFANNQSEISSLAINNISSTMAIDFSLVGFAAGTTGGQGGSEITVTDGATLQSAIKNKGSQPLTIYVNGKITPSNSGVSKIDVKDVSDISIIGVGTNGEFEGIGIKITRASNIIIQNLKIHHVDTGDKDCISIEGPADHIWVDHCELYNDLDHDKDYYDGLLDAKNESEYITYSWNYLHDSYKTCLVGSSDSDEYDRKITFHHNFFENCYSRLPLYRFGTGHLFNNYFEGIIDTGINSRMGAKLRIENNYFENSKDPIGFWYSSETGYWDVSNNKFVNCTGSMPTTSTCSFNPSYNYANYLHDTDDVKSIVMQYAGVGKLNTVTYPTPVLTPDTTTSGVSSVTITIDNWGNATIRRYRIDDGSWQNYSSPVVVTENCTIYAQGSDSEGNTSSIGSLSITNIGDSGGEPGDPNVLFSDNFESGSSAWTEDRGEWSVTTDGSKVYYHSDLVEGRTSAGSSSWTNYSVEARVKVENFNGSNRAYVCGRYRDGNNFYAASLSNGQIELRAKVSGSTTTLASKSLSISTGVWYTVKLELDGSSINMYVDGVLQLSATNSSITSGGIGLVPYKVIAKYDDVSATSL